MLLSKLGHDGVIPFCEGFNHFLCVRNFPLSKIFYGKSIAQNWVQVDVFSIIPIRMFCFISGKLISNVLLLMNPAEVDRIVCCNIREMDVKEAFKEFCVIADFEAILGKVDDFNKHILPFWNQ